MNEKKEFPGYIRDFIISDEAKEIIKSSHVFNKEGFDIWSFKKLIFLEYYMKPFLLILSNKFKSKCYFIDFFSGCGANQIENKNIESIGSPILSLLKGVIPNKSKNINNRFYKWIFIDYNQTFCDALKKRIEKTCEIIKKKTEEDLKIGKDIEIFHEDSNKLIKKIVERLEEESKNERIAVLVFIDPFKFSDIEWETIKSILTLRYVDVIFTLPTGTLRRGIDICKSKEKFLPPLLLEECSKKNFSNIPEENIEEIYAKEIAKIVKRPVSYFDKGISVRNSTNSELYKIELFSHSKKAVEIAEGIAKKLEKIDFGCLKQIIALADHKQKSLNEF